MLAGIIPAFRKRLVAFPVTSRLLTANSICSAMILFPSWFSATSGRDMANLLIASLPTNDYLSPGEGGSTLRVRQAARNVSRPYKLFSSPSQEGLDGFC